MRVVRVAGTSFTDDAFESDTFEPRRTVLLRPELENPADPNAVAIFDESGKTRVGYVPRACSESVRADLERDRLGKAIVAWQWRDLDSGRRTGLCVLIPRRGLRRRYLPEITPRYTSAHASRRQFVGR